jgi:hypothetical protein
MNSITIMNVFNCACKHLVLLAWGQHGRMAVTRDGRSEVRHCGLHGWRPPCTCALLRPAPTFSAMGPR